MHDIDLLSNLFLPISISFIDAIYVLKPISVTLCVLQVSTGLIQIKEAQRMPSRSSVIWKLGKPASLQILLRFPAKPGGPNPVPAPTNPSGLELTSVEPE